MNTLYDKIDTWLDQHREEMIEDLRRIVRIPSVSSPGMAGGPYGADCKAALDEMLKMGRKYGFHTRSYEDYVGSIGPEESHMSNTIGFWNHLDVVPVGNNWQYEPFEATLKEPFLIGRGVGDNKGPAIGMLYLMRCMKELEIPLKHELCLFVGCDEEKGMSDLEYYVSKYETPALSLIADCGFPVCYGEKGILEGEMITKETVSEHIRDFRGGIASNMIPDEAGAMLAGDTAFLEKLKSELKVLACEQEASKAEQSQTVDKQEKVAGRPVNYFTYEEASDSVTITYHGISRHSAAPQGSSNAICGLCRVLSGLSVLPESDRKLIETVQMMSQGYFGEVQGIAYEDEISGMTTCAATMIALREGRLCLTLNIRYAITADNEKDMDALTSFAGRNGLIWDMHSNSRPNYFPKENPVVGLLTDVFNKATGENRESYVMGGGTYARKLPNAIAYGLGGLQESEEDKALRAKYIQPGHGGAHEPDEVLNLHTFMQGLKIYARAILALNEVAF